MAEQASPEPGEAPPPAGGGGGIPQIVALLAVTGLVVWASASLFHHRDSESPTTSTTTIEPPVQVPPVSVHESTTVVRPDRPTPPGGRRAELTAAGNEFESFQVAVEGGDGGHGDVSLSLAGGLSGPGTAVIPAGDVTIYREAAVHVTFASDREGEAGDWYDALIPERDPYYGQDRNAFPYDIAAGGKMVGWVDVFVPAGTRAGVYQGDLRVTAGGGTLATIPVRLRVLDWTMPSTSSLRSLFLSTPEDEPDMPCTAHDGIGCDPGDERGWLLDYLYSRAGLENRVTVANPSPVRTPDFGEPVQRELFHRFAGPLLDGSPAPPAGSGLHAMRLQGAALTTIWAGLGEDCFGECIEGWRRLLGERTFASDFLYYLCDEPHDDATYWAECASRAASVGADVPLLVTATRADAEAAGATGYVDILVTNVTQASPDDQPGDWLYTSCTSHGCGPETACAYPEEPTEETDGWPGYVIDEPASQARAMGWLAYDRDAGGELYYSATWTLDTAWTDQCVFGGNGDGNLFYPGHPQGYAGSVDSVIGGTTDIPIESIRLKRIRDGREDYEYLHELDSRGLGERARAIATGLLGEPDVAARGATFTQADLDRARCELAELLDPSLGGCPTAPAP